MASIRKEKYKPKKIFLLLMLKMHQYTKKNKGDSKFKIITFIEFLIHHVGHAKMTQIIKDSNELFKTYSDMLNDEILSNEVNPLISNLSFLDSEYKKNIIQKITYANPLVVQTNKILKVYNQSLDENDLIKLYSDLIALIFINYKTLVFNYKASKNLEDETLYKQKLECASTTLEFVNRIRVTLLKLLPTNMNLMMVLLNTLLEKLY
jgi:hypothetical protein